jgi:general secretion pathway protein E
MDGRTDISWSTSLRYRLSEKALRLSGYAAQLAAIDPVHPLIDTLRGAEAHSRDMADRFARDLSTPEALSDAAKGLTLDRLGYAGAMLAGVRRLAREPYGMLLVTGPTGSGKTTTLYAAIGEIHHGHEKIITIEDPVEYELPGVVQVPVNERKGLSFARGLRSMLRHDPDRVLVGEIRDAETAQIAVQAALTGHLVFSTVHANHALDVIGRFMHMGLDLYNLVSALNAVLAQRLLRRLCAACAVPLAPDDAQQQQRLAGTSTQAAAPRRAVGCPACRGTGYRGRLAVAELLVLDDALRDLIVARAPLSQIKQRAREQGLRPLAEVALDLVRKGLTTLEEVDRVVAP